MPELVTSIVAVRSEKSSIAFGNVIGSNIFNLLLVLGLSSVVRPIEYSINFNYTLMILILITILIWIFDVISEEKKITKSKGIVMLLIYAEYILMLV